MTVETKAIRKHVQVTACPSCRWPNEITPEFEQGQQTERRYYIKMDERNHDCRVCAAPFNLQLELKIEKIKGRLVSILS